MASKRTKRQKNKVNKERLARARAKVQAKAISAASTWRCCICPAAATRDSSDFLSVQPPMHLCSVCHRNMPAALSVMAENECPLGDNGQSIAYHGTSSVFLPSILKNGLVSRRESAAVYYTPLASRAEDYAKSWVVGMHAGGVTDSLSGVVLSFPILDGDECKREQPSDWAVSRLVAPTELTVEKRIDLSDLRQESAEYIGYLLNFIGIVRWRPDAYCGGNPFAPVLRNAKACHDRLEKSVPISVLRDTIYVPWM